MSGKKIIRLANYTITVLYKVYTHALHSVRRKINFINVKGVGSNKDESRGIT